MYAGPLPLIAVAASFVLLRRLDLRVPGTPARHPGEQGRPRRRVPVIDVLVPATMVAWLFLAPMSDDDGYYAAMARNGADQGAVGEDAADHVALVEERVALLDLARAEHLDIEALPRPVQAGAQGAGLGTRLGDAVLAVLRDRGIDQLYSHQSDAITHALASSAAAGA